ncbi:MAG: prephenate dehydrogenase/arogenate dehydrogenase family protein [Bacteroidales bacterium]|nr:prephenate dehydrogenase/arogenate dehydrogenase family protein [Bacteroidales bacterium]
MKILILGAGKMGAFFADLLSFDHETAVYDINAQRLRFMYNTQRFTTLEEVRAFSPHLVINAVTLKHTLSTFEHVKPYLSPECILSDIASVKTGFKEYYASCGHPYVSTHPMFGPTFAHLGNLSSENAIIISEGDHMGRLFFRDIYARLGLHLEEYTFEEHDETMAYSLSIPFVSTFVFAAVMKHLDAPGTTFKRHLKIARGVLGEDEGLLREILFNPCTPAHLCQIREEMKSLIEIIEQKDETKLSQFLARIRGNIAGQ